jgi:hypothetical protein
MAIHVKQNETVADRRRMYFHVVDVNDGMTPENGEAGGQPQLSIGGAAWTDSDNTLILIGNGRYYVELSASEVANTCVIEGRYKSANTAEIPGTTIQIVAQDPFDVVSSIFSKKGITEGNTWDFSKVIKILAAWTMGLARDKSGETGVVEILDPDDGTTVIAELSRSDTTPYKTVTVKI